MLVFWMVDEDEDVDQDVDVLDGWVVFCGKEIIVIASTPDWWDLPAEDYFTRMFDLDQVVVSRVDEKEGEGHA